MPNFSLTDHAGSEPQLGKTPLFDATEVENLMENPSLDVEMTPGSENVPEDMKPDFEPYYPASRTHSRVLSDIISMPPENDPEDCFIVGEMSVMPLPLPSTNEGLVKRETDIISGNKPFTETVSFEILTKCY